MDNESISSFLCREIEECLDEDRFVEESVSEGLDNDYLRTIFDREIGCRSGSKTDGSSSEDCEGVKCVRSEAVTWILESRDAFGFRFQTAYLAVMYFDRFLAKRFIDSEKPWTIWLLAAACLSLAVKMEESTIPTLSNLQNQSEHSFNNEVIRRMELLVLSALEWRLRIVTPFAFLSYFTAMFRKDHHRSCEIMSKSVQIILAILRDISLVDRRPSAVAAAAASLAASDGDAQSKDDLESKMKSSRFHSNLDIDGVFSCHRQMRRLGKQRDDEEWTTPTAISLPMGLSNPFSLIPETSAITCENSKTSRKPKRKSPSADDDDCWGDPHFRGSPGCRDKFGD